MDGAGRRGRTRWPTAGSRRSTTRSSTRWCAEALAYNPDLRVAAARVEQAAGYVKARGRDALPAGQPARARRRRDERRLRAAWRASACSRTGSSTSGAACAPGAAAAQLQYAVGRARRRVRAPVDRRAGREELVPRHRGAAAEGASPRRWRARRSASSSLARDRAARRPRRRVRRGRWRRPACRPTATRVRQPRPRVPAGAARARNARRPLSRRGDRGAPAARREAGAGAGRDAVGAARAPARRRRRRAARRRRVLPRRGGEGGAPAAHLAHRGRHQHLERALRAQGPRQPGVERGRQR